MIVDTATVTITADTKPFQRALRRAAWLTRVHTVITNTLRPTREPELMRELATHADVLDTLAEL